MHMITQEVQRIGRDLEEAGHTLTTYDRLGITGYESLATDLRSVVEANEQFEAENAAKRIGMIMCKDKSTKAVGALLVKPVMDVLFRGNEQATTNWNMYTVNHFHEGHTFKPHQDYVDGTVMIITTLGLRQIDIYNKEPEDDVFLTVNHSYLLDAGSILVLNGYKDMGHAAKCIDGPSISIVADVLESVTT